MSVSEIYEESNIEFHDGGAEQILESLKKDAEEIKEMFNEIDFMMEEINGNEPTWSGKSQREFYNSYRTISDEFPKITENLDDNNNYLQTTIESYRNADVKIEQNAKNSEENLNIN